MFVASQLRFPSSVLAAGLSLQQQQVAAFQANNASSAFSASYSSHTAHFLHATFQAATTTVTDAHHEAHLLVHPNKQI